MHSKFTDSFLLLFGTVSSEHINYWGLQVLPFTYIELVIVLFCPVLVMHMEW